MKSIIAVLLALTATMAMGQEQNKEVSRKALTSKGMVIHLGDVGRNSGLATEGVMIDLGKRIVPQLQTGVGITPSINMDVDYLFDSLKDDLETEKDVYYEYDGAFFTMPIYAWVKYDFGKRIASPFVYANIGTQVSNYNNARGGLFRGINGGCRIALHKVALSPFIGYYCEGAKYNHISGGSKGISIGLFVEL